MKDNKGKNINIGDTITIQSGIKRMAFDVDSLSDGKLYVTIDGKKAFLTEAYVNKNVTKVEMLEDKPDVRGMLAEVLKDTNANYNVEDDGIGHLDLDELRFAGVGLEKNHMSMALNEDNVTLTKYGKIYSLLKEAFEISSEVEVLDEVSKSISNIANVLKKQIQ